MRYLDKQVDTATDVQMVAISFCISPSNIPRDFAPKKNAVPLAKYGVEGFPALIFVDSPDGERLIPGCETRASPPLITLIPYHG